MTLSTRSFALALLAVVAATSCTSTSPDLTTAQSTEVPVSAADTSAVQPTEVPVSTADTPAAQPTEVPVAPSSESNSAVPIASPLGFVKIANGDGGFAADIGTSDRFGRDHDSAGDIDGDGIIDLVAGARSDDDGPESTDGLTDAGAVYILFMNEDGTVRSHQKISSLHGGLSLSLAEGSFFGYGVAGIGDYDGDGIPDIAASAPGSRQSAGFEPSVVILHLNRDGTVKSEVVVSGVVGQGLSAVGDLDGDGRVDLVAADPGGGDAGRIRILFFDESSALRDDDVVVIGSGEGGFDGQLVAGDNFGGRESALLGDLDGDGSVELAVGAFMSDGGHGAVWILSLDQDTFQVRDAVKLAPGLAGFDETLPVEENVNGTFGGHFGHALAAPGDLDGDGVADLITSANQFEAGVGYVIYLNADATVKGFERIPTNADGLGLNLIEDDRFGRSISIVHQVDGTMTVNMGGGAASRQGGAIYALDFGLGATRE